MEPTFTVIYEDVYRARRWDFCDTAALSRWLKRLLYVCRTTYPISNDDLESSTQPNERVLEFPDTVLSGCRIGDRYGNYVKPSNIFELPDLDNLDKWWDLVGECAQFAVRGGIGESSFQVRVARYLGALYEAPGIECLPSIYTEPMCVTGVCGDFIVYTAPTLERLLSSCKLFEWTDPNSGFGVPRLICMDRNGDIVKTKFLTRSHTPEVSRSYYSGFRAFVLKMVPRLGIARIKLMIGYETVVSILFTA